MPPVTVVSHREEDSMNTEPSLSGKAIIGIIYPPPDIRTIVDKTAGFVARNGVDFENKIREKEVGNIRFNFLSTTDPYNAYYKHKVTEFQDGTAIEPSIQKPQIPDAVREHVQQVEFIPRDPPREFEFSADPATINAFDLDLIKLTALFVARNGRQFLTQLMNRELRNYQFDFLKPQHSNFSYFTKLVEQYTKVIIPPKSIVADLRSEATNSGKFMEVVKYRVDWNRHQRRMREREEAEAERERMAYAQIDWHDFVVVQTVDFQPNEMAQLPPLCTPKDVGTRILAQVRQEAAKAATQQVEMDMESDSDEEMEDANTESVDAAMTEVTKKQAYEVTQPMPAPPQAHDVVVKKDYDPKKARVVEPAKKPTDKWIISPLTGERIPADKLEDHMRFNTVDSQYFIQREREQMERADEEPVFAHGVDIGKHITRFAERRTDIFGVGAQGAEQTIIGKKLGEEDASRGPDPKTIWDGHISSIDATTKAAQHSITIDQQIAEIHRAHGFVSDKDRMVASSGQNMATSSPPQYVQQAPPMTDIPLHAMPATANTVNPQPVPPPLPVAISIRPVPIVHIQTFPTPQFPVALAPNPFLQQTTPMLPPRMPMEVENSGPPSKRQRTEEDLEPEANWLKRYPGSVAIRVQVPSMPERSEWKLEGNIEMFSMQISEQVGNLKNKIQDATGVPTSKQKLVLDGMFIKDQQSLAFYNMTGASLVSLQIKERGGRKK